MIVMQPVAALMKLQFLRGQPLVLELDQVRCRGLHPGQIMELAPILVHLDGITSNGVLSMLNLAPILPDLLYVVCGDGMTHEIRRGHYRREAKFGFGCASYLRELF